MKARWIVLTVVVIVVVVLLAFCGPDLLPPAPAVVSEEGEVAVAQAPAALTCKLWRCGISSTLYRASTYCYLSPARAYILGGLSVYPVYWYCWNQIVWVKYSEGFWWSYGFVYRNQFY